MQGHRRHHDVLGRASSRRALFVELEPRMIAQPVMRILPVLQSPPYAQNVMLAS
jgi:hypothetical protein